MEEIDIKLGILLVVQRFPSDKLHTIWEIFTEENDIDDDDEYVGRIFEEMADNGEIDLTVEEFGVKLLKQERKEKLKKLAIIQKDTIKATEIRMHKKGNNNVQ